MDNHLKPAGTFVVFVGALSFIASFFFAISGNMGLAGLLFFVAIGASAILNMVN